MHRPAQFFGPGWLAAGYYVVGGGLQSVVGVFTWGYDVVMGRGGFVSFFGPGPGAAERLTFPFAEKRKEKEGERGGNMDAVSDGWKAQNKIDRPASLVYLSRRYLRRIVSWA